jgi:hypothetical protein
MPGDNGTWAYYDSFLTSVFTAITNNDMLEGLDFEIWNEPDYKQVFWQRDQNQYLQMWGRAFPQIRAALPGIPIIGPCTAFQPALNNSWYAAYYPFVFANNSVPDMYCWHEETGTDDVATDIENNAAALAYWCLPPNPVILNEYGTKLEQNPGGAAWYMGRLERYNVQGLRGNWASGYALHDFFANLLVKPGAVENCTNVTCETSTGYYGNGEFNVYKYVSAILAGPAGCYVLWRLWHICQLMPS